MYKRFKPLKDTFIDSASYNSNFGKDEVLEVGKYVNTNGTIFPVRSLIKFNTNEIQNQIDNNEINSSSKFELKLYECQSDEKLYDDFYMDIHLISQSWAEGTGSKSGINEDGYANWDYATTTKEWDSKGGDYITDFSASRYFITSSGDLSVDVTNLVGQITASNYDNYGFLVKLRNEDTEENFNRKYFYSKETHTIYEPRLYAKWDDSIETGSYSDEEKTYIVSAKRPKNSYNVNEKVKFQFFIRDPNPTLSYYTSSIYDMDNTAINNLKYSVKDTTTNEVIIPFSKYTKCSYSGSLNYFYFDMGVLQPYRTYKLTLRHDVGDIEEFYDVHEFIVEE